MELVSGRQSYDLTSLLSLTASPNLPLIKTVNCVSVVHHPSSCNVLFQRKYLFEKKLLKCAFGVLNINILFVLLIGDCGGVSKMG